jgi:hypothetical protein
MVPAAAATRAPSKKAVRTSDAPSLEDCLRVASRRSLQ